MQFRVTMLVRNLDGLKARRRSKTARQKAALRQAVEEQGAATLAVAEDLCPIDTGFMIERLRLTFTRNGLNWNIGFRAEDFLGVVNPVTDRVVTAFYPVFVLGGTRHMAGNDFLTAALRLRSARIRAAYRKALTDA